MKNMESRTRGDRIFDRAMTALTVTGWGAVVFGLVEIVKGAL